MTPQEKLYPHTHNACPDCGKRKVKSSKRCRPCSFKARGWDDRPTVEQPSDHSYGIIPLTRGKVTFVDIADYERHGNYKWIARWNGAAFYAARSFYDSTLRRYVHIYLHREILGLKAGDKRQGDHANHDTLDNRKFIGDKPQLRIASSAQNKRNMHAMRKNTSGYKGVTWDKNRERWQAQAMRNGKYHFLGRFDTPEEAHAVYCAFAKEQDGEFTYTEIF